MGLAHWRFLFFIPAVLAAATAAGFLLLRIDSVDKVHQESVNYFKAFTKTDIRKIFIFIFAMSFLYHALYKWYGVYLTQEYGLDKKIISVILIMCALFWRLGRQIG